LDFTDLGLRAALLRSVRERGHVVPTPVQARAIPAILSGCDVTQIARAGTGRTAAYALPLLQRLMGVRTNTTQAVRALVLVESREIAQSVAGDVRSYGAYLPLRCSASYGRRDLKPRHPAPQPAVDIVVTTPARILTECRCCQSDLSAIEILVMDDADRILDRHPHQDIRRVFSYLSSRRQNAVFNASSSDKFELALGWLGYESGCHFGTRSRAQSRRHQADLPRRVRAPTGVGRVSDGRPDHATLNGADYES
jgi:ATP-dependent RNA helicase RhlE